MNPIVLFFSAKWAAKWETGADFQANGPRCITADRSDTCAMRRNKALGTYAAELALFRDSLHEGVVDDPGPAGPAGIFEPGPCIRGCVGLTGGARAGLENPEVQQSYRFCAVCQVPSDPAWSVLSAVAHRKNLNRHASMQADGYSSRRTDERTDRRTEMQAD